MKLRLGIMPKLMLVFVLFAIALVMIIGALSYWSGRAALEAAAISDLSSEAIQKQAALTAWVEERRSDINALSQSPQTIDHASALTGNPAQSQAARDRLVRELRTYTGPEREFLSLFVISPESGKVIVATDVDEIGQQRNDQLYFINGMNGPYG